MHVVWTGHSIGALDEFTSQISLLHNLGDTSALVVTTTYLIKVAEQHVASKDSCRGALVSTIAACL